MQGLGERVPKVRVVEKILRSLPPRFDPKIVVVEESKDVDELVGSLITYESRRFSPKEKSIALKTSEKEKEIIHEESSDDESFDSESIATLTRNFHKYLKHAKRTGRRPSKFPFKGESQKDLRDKSYKDMKTHFPQCYEC